MKTLGMLGGLGPESTIDYYTRLVRRYRERNQDGSYPPIIINSIDMNRLRRLVTHNQLAEMADYAASEIDRLTRAGADFGIISANTPHIAFDEIRQRSRLPLISIVEVTCDAADALGCKRVGLFGTRFTMQARFYPEVFERRGIGIVLPDADEQSYIHDKYFDELVNGVFLAETRERLLSIIDRLKRDSSIDAVVLGGTELPLLLRQTEYGGVRLLDTTQIHVDAAINQMFD